MEGISDLNKLSDYPDSLRSLSGLSAPNPIVGYPNQTIEIRIAPMSIKQNKKMLFALKYNDIIKTTKKTNVKISLT